MTDADREYDLEPEHDLDPEYDLDYLDLDREHDPGSAESVGATAPRSTRGRHCCLRREGPKPRVQGLCVCEERRCLWRERPSHGEGVAACWVSIAAFAERRSENGTARPRLRRGVVNIRESGPAIA
jgi:hypothetical protein